MRPDGDRGRAESPVAGKPAFQAQAELFGKFYPVAFYDNIQVQILYAQDQVARKPAHKIRAGIISRGNLCGYADQIP
jgi:hypothetical protein